MKKTFCLLLAACVCCTLLYGCTPSKEPSNGESNALQSSSLTDTSLKTESTRSSAPESQEAPAFSSSVASEIENAATGIPIGSDPFVFDHLTMTLPADFLFMQSAGTYIVIGPDYPAVSDNITLVAAAADSPDAYTKEAMDQTYGTILNGFIPGEIFERTQIDGHEAILYSYHIELEEVKMDGLLCYIFGSSFTDILTFTTVNGEYQAIFDACLDSIQVAD